MSEYFNKNKFKEIINGIKDCCELTPELLIKSATEIYLSSAASLAEETQRQPGISEWKPTGDGCMVKVSSIVECQACGHRRGRFIADTLDYCPACGKLMRKK